MGAISNSSAEVSITGAAVRGLRRADIVHFVNACLRSLRRRRSVPRKNGELSIAFVDDATMRRLNRRFRSQNRTTDVLTFEGAGGDEGFGEIIISLDQARRQAKNQKHPIATEIRYLLLHGIIHALGYDHETDDGQMNTLEIAIRPTVGLE